MPARVQKGYRGEIYVTSLGLTNDQAGRLLGVSGATVSTWLHRYSVPPNAMDRLQWAISLVNQRADQVAKIVGSRMQDEVGSVIVPPPSDETVPGWSQLPPDVARRLDDVARALGVIGTRRYAFTMDVPRKTTDGKTVIARDILDAMERQIAELREELKTLEEKRR